MRTTKTGFKTKQSIALKRTRDILHDLGVSEDDKNYSLWLYELQFAIYHSIKMIGLN